MHTTHSPNKKTRAVRADVRNFHTGHMNRCLWRSTCNSSFALFIFPSYIPPGMIISKQVIFPVVIPHINIYNQLNSLHMIIRGYSLRKLWATIFHSITLVPCYANLERVHEPSASSNNMHCKI